MDDEDKFSDQLQEMIDNGDFQSEQVVDPNQKSFTDMAGQIWQDGKVVSNSANPQDVQLYDQVRAGAKTLMEKNGVKPDNPEGFSDKQIVNYLQSANRNGGVQPKIAMDDTTAMKAKWASDSAYFANRDISALDAHGPLTNRQDQAAIADWVNGATPKELMQNGLPPDLRANRDNELVSGGRSRRSQGLGLTMSKDQKRAYDIQKSNEFLTIQAPKMDQIARTVYDRIQKDPNLSKNIAQQMDGALGEVIKRIGDQAPNKLAQAEFNARAAQFRIGWAKIAQGDQFTVDQAKFQQDIGNQGDEFAKQASQDFQHEHKLIMDAYNSTAVALKGGMKPDQAQKHLYKTVLNIKQSAVNNMIQVAPELAMKRLQAGEYDELGPGVMKSMKMAQAALNSRSKQISASLSKRESDIISGKYTDYSFEDPANYSPQDRNRVAAYNNLVAKASMISQKTAGELTTLAQTSNDPMISKLSRSALDQISHDAVNYAYKQGIVEKVILDGSPESAQRFVANHYRIKSVLGLRDGGPIDNNPFPKEYVTSMVNIMNEGNAEKIVGAVNYLQYFGELTPSIINQIGRTKGGEAIKIYASQTDKRAIADIAVGLSNKGVISSIGKDHTNTYRSAQLAFDKNNNNAQYFYMQDPYMLKGLQYGAVGSTLSRNGENASEDDYQENVRRLANAVNVKSNSDYWGTDTYLTVPVKDPKGNLLSGEDMQNMIAGLTNDDFKKYGNSDNPKVQGSKTGPYAGDGNPIDFRDISPSRFQYIPVAEGKYALLKKGQPLRASNGDIYTINLQSYKKDRDN